MHRFLRAIGFSKIESRADIVRLMQETVDNSTECKFSTFYENTLYGDYIRNVGERMGLIVCGETDEYDEFFPETIYPYFTAGQVTTSERSSIDKHIQTDTFGGVCEDSRIAISIIYFLQNRIDYMRNCLNDDESLKGVSLSLSGLSDSGMIMMPIAKDENTKKKVYKSERKRDKLIKAAKDGNEEAIESLTLKDLDMYASISEKIHKSDLYTIVDTYFMPYGIECDLYSVMGEIEELKLVQNTLTGEEIYQMRLQCNGILLDVCINKLDLYGEPETGRRFKGNIWLQGKLNFQ